MDYVDTPSSSNCLVGVLKKANFSKVSSEEKLQIIRRFQNNPNFDELDLYYLGLLDEESSEEKIPKGSSETVLAKQPSKRRPNLEDEIHYLDNPPPSVSVKKITKGKGWKKRETKKAVVVFDDHSAPEAEAAEALLLLNHHPLPLDELPNKKKKNKLKIIMSGMPIDDCPIDDISGPKKKRPRTTTDDQEEEQEEDRCRAKKKRLMMAPAPPEVPPNLKKRIEKLGGSEVMLVIEKQLCQSDISTGNGRFSLPNKKINPQFLIPEEREFLGRKPTAGSPTLPQIEAQLIQPCGEELTINLREWHMKKPLYNLVTSWNDVVSTNSLHIGMIVQLWSFRVNSRLRLALVEAGKDIQ